MLTKSEIEIYITCNLTIEFFKENMRFLNALNMCLMNVYYFLDIFRHSLLTFATIDANLRRM